MKKITLALAIGFAWGLTGCNTPGQSVNTSPIKTVASPLAGSWTGKSEAKGGDLVKMANSVAGGPLTGPSSLKLDADGTGFMKIAGGAERPITWSSKDDKVVIDSQGNGADKASSVAGPGPWVGDVSSDGRIIVIEMEKVKVTLKRPSSD